MLKNCVGGKMSQSEKRDVESGVVVAGGALYPAMLENPQLRWSFIRKVYAIVTAQLLLTIAVASVVVFVRPVAYFFLTSTQGLILYLLLIIVPFTSELLCLLASCIFHRLFVVTLSSFLIFVSLISFAALCPLYCYHKKYPLNYFLLSIFTISLSFLIGLTCAFVSGKSSKINLYLFFCFQL